MAGRLAGYRRIRTGSTRTVRRVDAERVEVLIVVVGQRRDRTVCQGERERDEGRECKNICLLTYIINLSCIGVGRFECFGRQPGVND